MKTLLLPTDVEAPSAGSRRGGVGGGDAIAPRIDEDRATGTTGTMVDARPGSAEEKALIERCRAGDRAAMRLVYERFQRRIFSVTTRIAGPQDAEELTQEVFFKAFRALDKFRGDAQLGTWLYRLAVNAALSHVGRSKSRHNLPEENLRDVPAPSGPTDGDPRMRVRLERAVARLPPGYRAVIVLHDVEGLEHEEIASVLGCTVGTSKSQLHKARAKMRELLGPALASERGGTAR